MRNFKCPSCGGNLSVEDDSRDFTFCQYCGSKIMLDDYRSTHRIVDEAKIIEAETERLVKLKELEITEQNQAEDTETKNILFKVIPILLIAGIILTVIGYIIPDTSDNHYSIAGLGELMVIVSIVIAVKYYKNRDEKRKNINIERAKVPSIVGNSNQHYEVVKTAFENAGFTNVKCIALKDIHLGLFANPGIVSDVSINGKRIITGGAKYPKNVPVIITYHSKA